MTSLVQRIYYINTLNKAGGTNENFQYHIQIPNEGYDRVVLLQASIPSSFYMIQDGFNTFNLVENDIHTPIAVPAGNYSAKVFAKVVKELMNTASPHQWIYDITLPNSNTSPSTGKFTFSVTGNSSQPCIVCTLNVNEQLGFAINSTNTFVGNNITSSTTVNFALETTIFIKSDIGSNGDSNILQEIYSGNNESFSYITYHASQADLYSKELVSKQSGVFNFSIINEKGQLMNLNGVDAQFTICLFKQDKTNEMIREYIRYKVHSDSTPESAE